MRAPSVTDAKRRLAGVLKRLGVATVPQLAALLDVTDTAAASTSTRWSRRDLAVALIEHVRAALGPRALETVIDAAGDLRCAYRLTRA